MSERQPDEMPNSEWLDLHKPDSLDGRGELLQALETPGKSGAYRSTHEDGIVVVTCGYSSTRIDPEDMKDFVADVHGLDIPDPDDLDEGYMAAMNRKAND